MSTDAATILEEWELQSIETRLRPDNRGTSSTCSAYTCDCHDEMPATIATIRSLRARIQTLTPATTARADAVREYREALTKAAIPYEGLLMDRESRKWIAPTVWKAIEDAVVAIRKSLLNEMEKKDG